MYLNTEQPNHLNTGHMDAILFSYVLAHYELVSNLIDIGLYSAIEFNQTVPTQNTIPVSV